MKLFSRVTPTLPSGKNAWTIVTASPWSLLRNRAGWTLADEKAENIFQSLKLSKPKYSFQNQRSSWINFRLQPFEKPRFPGLPEERPPPTSVTTSAVPKLGRSCLCISIPRGGASFAEGRPWQSAQVTGGYSAPYRPTVAHTVGGEGRGRSRRKR